MSRPAPASDSLLERRLVAEHQTLAQPLRNLLRREPVVCTEGEALRAWRGTVTRRRPLDASRATSPSRPQY